ncbi:hypothetical protein H6F67_17790 [Microcoleus sp. FACHB-1515]|uniref:hypothetical protein n=1 Tax=Leptolyngbya sp. FACHB-1515 TaxID=2933931 RepID=UPI00199C436A|nr:hypothetical protein [Microcoleus sp. FACHB-1515]
MQRKGVGDTDLTGVDSGLGEVIVQPQAASFTVDDRAQVRAIEQPKLTHRQRQIRFGLERPLA